MNLKDKICIVTGAAKGIGLSISKALVEKGANVVLLDNDQHALDELIRKNENTYMKGYVCDISDEQQLQTVVKEVEKDCGPISVWINNAGLARHAPVIEIDEQQIDLMMNVNVKGTILGSKYALNQMKKNKTGHIINIISTAGLNGIPNQSVYSATKFAVKGFTEALEKEASQEGVKVTAIYPGGVDTEFWDHAQEERPPSFLFLTADHIAKSVVQVLELDDITLIKSLVLRSIHDTDVLESKEAPV